MGLAVCVSARQQFGGVRMPAFEFDAQQRHSDEEEKAFEYSDEEEKAIEYDDEQIANDMLTAERLQQKYDEELQIANDKQIAECLQQDEYDEELQIANDKQVAHDIQTAEDVEWIDVFQRRNEQIAHDIQTAEEEQHWTDFLQRLFTPFF